MKANPLTTITASYRNWQAYAGNPNLSNARKLHGQRVLANVEAAKARLLSDLKRLAAMEAEIMATMEADTVPQRNS